MLKHLLIFSGFVFIFMLVFLYIFQRNLIYFPALNIPERSAYDAEDMQSVFLRTSDNLKLNAWYKPAVMSKPTLLYLHGNAGHIGHRMYIVRHFISQGFGVLLLDYRGYGGNKGRPTEDGLYKDGRAAMYFLQQQGIKDSQIMLYGESLGTGVATQLATEFRVCALILQSPFTSLTHLARYHYPWLPMPPKDQYNSLDRIKNIHIPLLFLHGKHDSIVPYDQGRQLFNQANEPKQWAEFTDRGHNDLWDSAFVQVVNHFINQTSCLPPAKLN